MSALQQIDSTPDLTDQVYQRLLGAICAGELAPGARLNQEELAATLNVSRQPVLQALRLLRRDGVAVESGRRGLAVAPLDPAFIVQIYEVRAVLEGLAAREAANAATKLDPAVIERGRRAVAGNRVGPMLDADLEFHSLIYAASGNPLIAESVGRHWHHIRRACGAALQAADLREHVWDEHLAILDAVNAGDAVRAEFLARRHCEDSGRFIGARLAAHAAASEPPQPVHTRRST
jgi:DNA-binding GntR family transcriptional regulator